MMRCFSQGGCNSTKHRIEVSTQPLGGRNELICANCLEFIQTVGSCKSEASLIIIIPCASWFPPLLTNDSTVRKRFHKMQLNLLEHL